METRILGRTGHRSTVAIFGAAAFWDVDQAQAERTMDLLLEHRVNHIDVAPSYGVAEERLGPLLPRVRDRFFLGCKTMERDKAGAAAELRRSLERLRTDHFDLYQIHAITTREELDTATGPGGALEAIVEAQNEDLTRFIGITGHGNLAPSLFLEALDRFAFDTVLFPLNFVQYANPAYRSAARALLRRCREENVGTMTIKSVARGPWGERPKTHTTWYEPFTRPENIQPAIDFVLSQGVTGLCTVGDTRVLPLVLDACEAHRPMSAADQERMIAKGATHESIFE